MTRLNLKLYPTLSGFFSKTFVNSVTNKIMEKSFVIEHMKISIPSGDHRHKGQAGRIGIIGGSLEYTGAPYYAGISALRAGADLVHIFCDSSAAIPIKCYSPELIVHPLLDNTNALALVTPWLDRLHSIVIGPGLGREASTFKVVSQIIGEIKDRQIPLVIDADGLFLITENIELLKDFKSPVVLTPNAMEYQRLCEKIGGRSELIALGDTITVLKKGMEDEVINVNPIAQWKSSEGGSSRRCGGQGDVLSGLTATYLNWTLQNENKLNKGNETAIAVSVACYAACAIVRKCNEKAFTEMGLGMLTTDMIKHINESFREFLSSAN